MTNQEYIDAINKAIDEIEKLKTIDLSGGIYSRVEPKINFGTKRLCTQCLTAYVGDSTCSCGNVYTEEL